jgi:hypothetical protein
LCNLAASVDANARQSDACPPGLRATLERGGFSGGIFCDPQNASFSLVGVAATPKAKYSVYDYRYRFLPEDGNVWHGGQRMIIIRDGEYLGQFVLDPPTTLKLSGMKLTLSKPNVETAAIDLATGVPTKIFFDGDVMSLQR